MISCSEINFSNSLRLIKFFLPTSNEKEQDSSFKSSRNLFVPIFDKIDASSTVKFSFSQIGISKFLLITITS